MRIPTVHINGTDGLELFDQMTFASLAVEHAMCKLREAWPNARDYYVQDGGDPVGDVIGEWRARVSKLSAVKEELVEIMEGITKQLKARGADPWAPR